MAHTHGPKTRATRSHSHMWLIGLVGIVAGAVLMIYVPSLKAVSASLLLFAGFHIVGGIVLLASFYVMALRGWIRRLHAARPAVSGRGKLDFGWGPGWMNGLAVAALATFAAAVAVQVAWPAWWPLTFLLVFQGALFLVGNAVMSSFRHRDYMVLPMVDLMRHGQGRVLDAGCGAGRTTIALSRILADGRVTAVDRFDADYIDDGGRALLERNLAIAGLTERVDILTADLTALPLDDASIDAAVSTNVFDHLGAGKRQALAEIRRVLRPGGRFLMAVWVPGLTMFAVASVLSLALTSRRRWRELAEGAGLKVVDEGVFNHVWFVVLEKPAT